MKSTARFLAVLAISVVLGFAAYALIQSSSPSASPAFAQGLQSAEGFRGSHGAGALGGHPQGAPGGAAIAFVTALGKFLAIFAAIAALRFGASKIVSRKRKAS
jgi:hypothetical protein